LKTPRPASHRSPRKHEKRFPPFPARRRPDSHTALQCNASLHAGIMQPGSQLSKYALQSSQPRAVSYCTVDGRRSTVDGMVHVQYSISRTCSTLEINLRLAHYSFVRLTLVRLTLQETGQEGKRARGQEGGKQEGVIVWGRFLKLTIRYRDPAFLSLSTHSKTFIIPMLTDTRF
jgi:hypothetical protein